ncbi:dehydroascorbate transporter [Spirochaetia bacterium]|nr:dehydroascorbate transporter [Spirochaetia bacterium]
MSKGGLSFRIVQFSKLIIGRVRGGLGYAAVLASIVFAGLSGSAIADAAAIGGLLVPLMIANGYNKARATAFVCSGAIIAPIIPPSIAFVLIGSMTGLSISKLFMVGIVPGVYIGLALMVTWFFIVRKDNYHDVIKFSLKESLIILKESIPALILPMIIIGGVRFGMFTPTEAGAFAVVYALVISVFWYKEFKITDVRRVFVDTAITTAAVMLIVGAATAVGYFMTMAQLPAKISDLFGGLTYNPILFLLASMLFLLTMGMVMDATPNNLIFAPILIPIAIRAGINPYYYALLINLNLNIGLLTPPVGTILYIGAGIGGVPVTEIIKNILPFLFVEMLVLLIFIFFPQVVMIPFEFLT